MSASVKCGVIVNACVSSSVGASVKYKYVSVSVKCKCECECDELVMARNLLHHISKNVFGLRADYRRDEVRGTGRQSFIQSAYGTRR